MTRLYYQKQQKPTSSRSKGENRLSMSHACLLHSLAIGYDESNDDEALITVITIVLYNEPNVKPSQVLVPLNACLSASQLLTTDG